MTGQDEEAISKPDIKTNGGKIIKTILERCVTEIGSISRKEIGFTKWREIINNLTIGDQDYALMKIRQETLGNEITLEHSCPSCKTALKTVVDVDELEVTQFNGFNEMPFELPKGYVNKEGRVLKSGFLRHPNGLDREFLDQVARKNMGMANTMLLTRCMISLEDATIHDDLVRNLSIRDREYLLNIMKENKFGVVLETEVTCSSCGETIKGNLSTTNFI